MFIPSQKLSNPASTADFIAMTASVDDDSAAVLILFKLRGDTDAPRNVRCRIIISERPANMIVRSPIF